MAISLLHENTPDQMKTQILSLVASQKPSSLKKLEFEFNKKQLQRAKNNLKLKKLLKNIQ